MRSGTVHELEQARLEGDSVLVGFRVGGIFPRRLSWSDVATVRRKVTNVAGTVVLLAGSVGAVYLWWGLRRFSCRTSGGCT